MNFADKATASAISLPVDRWGGNTTDTYDARNNHTTYSYNTSGDVASTTNALSPFAPGASPVRTTTV